MGKWEARGKALEGTGSLVLDRQNRIAYAALSKRTNSMVIDEWAAYLDYSTVTFDARDRSGEEIYHTNVLMSIGATFAVVCTESIRNGDECERTLASLRRTGKEIIDISMMQMESFAGNCIHLQGEKGTVLAISAEGWDSLSSHQRHTLEGHADQVVAAQVPTIER